MCMYSILCVCVFVCIFFIDFFFFMANEKYLMGFGVSAVLCRYYFVCVCACVYHTSPYCANLSSLGGIRNKLFTMLFVSRNLYACVCVYVCVRSLYTFQPVSVAQSSHTRLKHEEPY